MAGSLVPLRVSSPPLFSAFVCDNAGSICWSVAVPCRLVSCEGHLSHNRDGDRETHSSYFPLDPPVAGGGIFTMFPLKSLGGKTIKGVLAKWKHWFISSFGACSYSS